MRIVSGGVIQDKSSRGSAGCSAPTFLFSAWLLVAAPLSAAEPRPPAAPVCSPPIQWQAGLGDDTYQRFHRILNRSDGGYLAGGQYFGRDEGIWLVALLSNGSNAWQRFYGATGSHYLNDLQPAADGGYIIAGSTWVPGGDERGYQAELTRIDAKGDVLWTRTYGGSDLDGFESVRQTSDGGFIAAGGSWGPTGPDKTSPHYGQGDAWIVKLDAGGNKVWERSYGGTGLDGAGNIVQTADGNYLVSISSDSPADGNKSLAGFGGFDSWILKLDPDGQKIWERSYGTTNHDGLVPIGELPDGSFLLSGYASSPAGGNKTSASYGGSDAWVVLIDSNGNRIWERSFGGTDSDALYSGRRMADGGYILAGYSQSPVSGNKTSPKVGGNDMWLVRIDSAGNKLWERTIGGGNPYGSSANDVAITPDGGFVVAGETFNDIGGDKTVPWLGSGDGWIVKLGPEDDGCDSDHDGVPNDLDQCPNTPPGAPVDARGCPAPICPPPVQWQHSFGGADYDYLYSLEATSDGGYILGGLSYSPANGNKTSPHLGGSFDADVWLIRLNAGGEKVWERAFGGNEDENALSVKQTANGGFIVAGWSASGLSGNKTSPPLGREDGWVIRLDAQGNKLWERTFGGASLEYFFQVHELFDGGFILGGFSTSCPNCVNGEADCWIVRIDGQGNKLWERFYGGTRSEPLFDLQPTSDGGFILGGGSASPPGVNKTSPNFGGYDFWVVRLDGSGNKLWDQSFGGRQDEEVRSLRQTSDGGFLLAGRSYSGVSGNKTSPSHGSSDYWLVRIAADGTKLWDKSFGGSRNDELYTMSSLPDGGWLLGGESGSLPDGTKTSPYYGGDFPGGDYWVVRLDADANPVWDQSLGGAQDDFIRVVRPATDGGIVLAGYAESGATGNKTTASFGAYDWWIVKLAPPSPDDCDTDRDGVPNDCDECPNTPPGAVANAQGCSIPQLCPCDGPWRNHGEYVRCVIEHAWQFYRDDLISAAERRDHIRDAASSDCGRRHGVRLHLQPQTPAEVQQHGREFIATGDLTGGCVLEASTNLVHWTPVATNRTAGVECRIADPVGHKTPTRFYRLRLLPR